MTIPAELEGLPRGYPGERFLHWRKRVTPEQLIRLLIVSRRLGHCDHYHTFNQYIRVREST